ncbi:unnamed protein product [Blepharisma stoltei]|uniref:Uncharacterized protein n=1 Tax=Blepharisma stoltei TaxID=1481888 RepID=A0AAU9JDY9_9CILI|nr:unnamed protein product [Blepharisma stoltei]
MLITYILVLIYAYYSINAVRDANVPIILENLGESFIQMGLFSRLASIFKDFGDNIVWQFSYKYFAINIQNLEIFYSKAISLLSKNNLCSAQDFFIQKNINLWKVNNGIYREKASLLDTTSQFIQLVNYK